MKNILKKILNKKKSKKVAKKKTKVIKKATKPKKIVKKKKVIKEIVKKKVIKKIKKEKKVKTEIKTDLHRIPKNNEQKPEIKKVKKQDSEKKLYKAKDYVVYPKHGVGQIIETKKINIGGIDVETYILKFEKDKANGMVPVNKQSHLRPLATINQINKCTILLIYKIYQF